jgi:hypothetical protein
MRLSTHASLVHWSDKNNTCQAFFHKKNCAYLCHCNGFESTCAPPCNIKDINGIPCILVIYKGSLTTQDTRFPRRLGLLDPCKALCSFKTSRTINPATMCHLPKDLNPLIIYCSNLPSVTCREIKLQKQKKK